MTLRRKGLAVLVLLSPSDARAVRNKDTILAMYDLLINTKKSIEAGAKFLVSVYIQRNPLLENNLGTSRFFDKVTAEHANVRIVVHRIIAVGTMSGRT
jgi:predicted SnoaL-like aldol condensation-catalyzing enzyme